MRYRRQDPYSAPPFKVTHRPEDLRVVTLPVPGYRQARNYSCGFAASLMVLRHFGCKIPGRQLFETLGTARDGTGQSAIIRTLRGLGLRANLRYDMDFVRMTRSIDAGKPLIGYLHDVEHWVVIYGYGLGPERIYVADPEPERDCEQPWESYGERLGGFGIVCSLATAPLEKAIEESPQESAPEAAATGQLSFNFG